MDSKSSVVNPLCMMILSKASSLLVLRVVKLLDFLLLWISWGSLHNCYPVLVWLMAASWCFISLVFDRVTHFS